MFESIVDWCNRNDLLASALGAKVAAGLLCFTLQFGFGIG